MKRCNPKLQKANDPKYECNPETGRWNIKPVFKKGYKKKTVRKKVVQSPPPIRPRKKVVRKSYIPEIIYNASVFRTVPKQLDLEQFVRNFKLKNGFTSKRYVRKQNGELFVYFDPPNGPIPDGAQCSYGLCNKKDGQNHSKTCSTPLRKYLIISDKGLGTVHNNRLNKYFDDNRISDGPIQDVLNEETPFGYELLFPALKPKDEWSIENMVTLVYEGTKVRIAADSSMHILYGPDNLDPKKIYENIFGKNSSELRLKYTLKRFTFSVIQQTKNIDMALLNRFLKNDVTLENYKYSTTLKRIMFAHTSDSQTMTFMINRTGKVQVILTKSSGRHKLSEQHAKTFLKDLIHNIPGLSKPVFQGLDEQNIKNIRSMDDAFRKNTPLKPQVCTGNNKLTPTPYAFAGKCSKKGYAVMDEGVHYSKARNARVKAIDRYGPCCYKITGKSASKVGFDSNKLPGLFIVPVMNHDKFVKNCTGKRKIFIRRIIHGFPNDKYAQDSKIKNDMVVDNKAANYNPGTKVIEKRAYKGLLDIITERNKTRMIRKILNIYKNN